MSSQFGLKANSFAQKRFLVQPMLICLMVFAIAFGSIAYVTTFSARQLDDSAQAVSRQLLATALLALTQDLSGRTYDYAWWDDLYERAVDGIDPDWAAATIGEYMQTDFGQSGTYVLDPDHRTIFADNADRSLPNDALAFLGNQAGPILNSVQSQPMDSSSPVSSFLSVGDRVFLVSAAPIMPEAPTAEQLDRANRPVLVFHREITPSIEVGLARLYELRGLRIRTQNTGEDSFPIEAHDGSVAAWATWAHPRPGDTLIHQLLPAVFIATAVLLTASVTVYTMWFRSALAANKAKTAFFAKMTHELRTPLNAIIGFSDIMRSEMMGPLSQQYRQYANDINWSGQHLKQLVEDVLDVSKMETEGISLRETVVDLNQLLDDVAQLSLPEMDIPISEIDNQRLSFRREVDVQLPQLKADEFRLRQVLINLLSNAAKHSNGKEIIVRAGQDGDGGIRIEVEDHGCGIPKEDMEKVFTPFFQSGNEDMGEPRRGTGLGLSIARDLIRLHGGSLTLSSELGVGTTASIHFPAARTVAIGDTAS